MATAFCEIRAAHSAAMNWPVAVAVMTIGMDAPTAVGGTYPMLTSPSAMPPTRNAGTPIAAGSPSGTGSGSPASSLMCCSKTAEWLM